MTYYVDQPPPGRLETFVDIARWRAERSGNQVAFTFLDPGRGASESIDYHNLDRRIRSIAAVLRENGRAGGRVLIVQQPGIEYIASLFGCMRAGMVAVPVYPLDVFRLRHTLPRLQAITRDADAPIMLTSGEAIGGDGSSSTQNGIDGAAPKTGPLWELCRQAVIFTDTIDPAVGDRFVGDVIRPDDLAVLQYTSGTTGQPRGVALRHRHLLANAQQIYAAFDVRGAVCVFWLPPYHDMGLVGGLLMPMFAGRHSVLMSPTSFVQQPIAWLDAISRYRATTTASPNFGFELCLRKINDDALATLDLSCLQVMISGAEPIRASTMRRFASRFAAVGFRSGAFTPAYGMAEATLAITGKPRETEPVAVRFCADELHGPERHAVEITDDAVIDDDAAQSVEIVCCGVPLDHNVIRIVNPQDRRPLADDHVGEIWVQGPSVATEYWQKPELSAAIFRAEIDEDANAATPVQTFLRTGDLGFIHDGQLFVSGRLKDLIIIAGRNYFAHELEAAIQGRHEALKVDGGAAFSVEGDDGLGERLVVVQEVLRPKRFDLAEVAQRVRAVLAEQFDLSPAAVVLVVAGSLSKTSSGKLQRGEARRQFLAGELQPLHAWRAGENGAGENGAGENGDNQQPLGDNEQPIAAADLSGPVARQVVAIWREVLELDSASPDQHFLDVGGQSLAAIALLSRIRQRLGVTVDVQTLFTAPRLGDFVVEVERIVAAGCEPAPKMPQSVTPAIGPATRLPLTATQRRFWLLDQMEWRQAFLHVELTISICGDLDHERLARLVERLPCRHDALRIRVIADESATPWQRFADDATIEVRQIDLRSASADEARRRLMAIRDEVVHRPFDLANGPVARAAIIRTADDQTSLVLAAHHLVCDGTSLAILVQDLAACYNKTADLPHSSAGDTHQLHCFADAAWAQSQRSLPSGDALAYWHDRLRGVCADSALAVFSPQPEIASTQSIDRSPHDPAPSRFNSVRLSDDTVERLRTRCRQWGVTPFEVLLSAWNVVLGRYAESDEMVLGAAVAGRDSLAVERTVGCFINTLPVRLAVGVDESFGDCVKRVSGLWRADSRHAAVPLDAMIDGLALPRTPGRLPLVQHLVLHQPPVAGTLSFGNCVCESFGSDYSTLGAYDTALVCQWRGDGASSLGASSLGASSMGGCELGVSHSTAVVDDAVAANMLDGLVSLLAAGLATPDEPLRRFAVGGESECADRTAIACAEVFHAVGDTVLDLFARQVAANPDGVAIIDAGGAVTFDSLDRDSTRIAMWLRRRGVVAGSIIALRLSRGRRITEMALAAWKAGAAYLPLDPSYPAQRLADILDDAQPRLVIDDQAYAAIVDEMSRDDRGPESPVDDQPLPTAATLSLAYLIYTSGSTGKPKGVMIGHAALSNVLKAFARRPGLAAGRRILAATTMSFDISVLELFLPLVTGATSVMSSRSLSEDPDDCLRLLDSQQVDVIQATPSSLRMMMAGGWLPRAGQTVWCGGEPMQVDLADAITATGARLWNVYGPTETTVWSLAGEIHPPATDQRSAHPISIGRPIDSTVIRVVDRWGCDSPIGVDGELWIGGHGVGDGYWNRPELTADRFVETETDGRMYRTGDRVRLLPDGAIEFLGRADRQIKIRGHRVELGEIESTLNRSDEVAESAVACIDLSPTDRRLVAFYRPTGLPAGAEARGLSAGTRIREFLESQLPAHMVPATLVPMSAIPHTPAGKIDYKRLPVDGCFVSAMVQGQGDSSGDASDKRMPTTETERQIAAIWSEVLGVESVGVDDHFFHLGGHSLMAAQVFARMRSRLGVELPLREIYARPTIAQLAARIDAMAAESSGEQRVRRASDGPRDDGPLAAFLKRRRARSADGACATSGENDPLSPAEQRLWFVDQLEPSHPFYNLPLAARIDGPLDVAAFWQAIDDCVARHETLRSTYHLVDGLPVRRVAESLRLDRESIDLRGRVDADEAVAAGIMEFSRAPFDLDQGPLIRVVHWRTADHTHVVLLVMHHIVSDGWSMSVMMRELAESYRDRVAGKPPQFRPLAATYRDYAAWQHDHLTPERIEPTIEYWKKTLSGGVETLDLPVDFPRPAEQTFDGATMPVVLSGELSARVDRLADDLGVTPFSVLLAAYGLLLSRLSGQRDLTIGTAVANRTDPMVEELIGFFVNTVVVRQRSTGSETFGQWVSDVHAVASEAIEHQEVPFEQVVGRIAQTRDRSHSPLFQAAFILQNTPDAIHETAGLTILPMPVDNGTAKYDLTLFLAESAGVFGGHFEFRTSLFRPETVARFIDSFLTLLDAAIASSLDRRPDDSITRIDDLPMLSAEAETAILARSQGKSVAGANGKVNGKVNGKPRVGLLHDLVADAMRRHADSVAIRHGDAAITYGKLDARADQIAHGLQASHVGPGDRVLIYSPRSIDQIAATIATMRCGAAFVPVDTQTPIARLARIATDLEPATVIVSEDQLPNVRDEIGSDFHCHSVAGLAAKRVGRWQTVAVSADDLAYLIFTSGSTGSPKGVAIPHRGIVNFVIGYAAVIGLKPGMTSAHMFSPSFDGALAEIFPPLVMGGTLQIIDQEVVLDPPRLADELTRHAVDQVALTPATLAMLQPAGLPRVRKLLSAGASLPGELAARWLATHELFNGYGPTECSVGVSIRRLDVTDASVPSVGRPLPNTRIYVLDSSKRPVPDGVIGEVYLGGAGVGRGYWLNDDLTNRYFMDDPFVDSAFDANGSRMYRSGDLGRWNSAGQLEIVGRCDEQIKLRGFRIEPGEIAAVLDSLPGVARAAVVSWGDDWHSGLTGAGSTTGSNGSNSDGAGKRLVAYVVPERLHADDRPGAVASTRRERESGVSVVTDDGIEREHVENWRDLFDQAQVGGAVVFDPIDNFSGWVSVITGRPIPTDEMRTWADEAAAGIVALRPRSVLEIGCGTGLMLLRIGDRIDQYVGIDVLQSAIDDLRKTLSTRPELDAKVSLDCRTADRLDDLPAGGFDTIVLNSVVQYFPSEEYFQRVLKAAQRLLAPGGRMFLGDLRNLRLHRAFAIATELNKIGGESITVGQFRERVRSRIEHDEELLVDPDLESGLRKHLSRLSAVTTRVKTAADDNELNRFRYDAVLWFDDAPDENERMRDDAFAAVCPNANVRREWSIQRMLDSADGDAMLANLLAVVDAERLPVAKPAEILAACDAAGWNPRIDWHPASDGDLIVAALASGRPVPKAVLRERIGAIPGTASHDVAERPMGDTRRPFTSRPLERRRAMRLIQRLKSELQSRLPSYMVPSAFVLVDHLPLTIQGKLDRAKLPPPPTMRMASATVVRGASTATERTLVEIWEELLEVAPIGVDDDFFDLGGHSMLAVRMVSLVQQRTGMTLPLAALFRKPTIAELADLLDDPAAGESSLIVPLAIGGDGEPLFCVHPAGGTVFCYRDLASRLAGSRPVFGVQARGLDGRDQPHQTLDEMAEDYAAAIRDVAPTGPIHLIGWSLGGNIAYEVARRITDGGRQVGSLALLDAGLLAAQEEMSEDDFLPLVAALFPGQQHQSLEELRQKSPGEQLAYFIDQAAKAGIVPDDPSLVGPHIFDVFQANIKAVHDYQPQAYSGNLLLIRPGDQVRTSTLFDDQCLGWRPMVSRVDLATVSGDHAHMLQSPAVDEIARHWTDYVQQLPAQASMVPLCDSGDSGDSTGIDQESIRC